MTWYEDYYQGSSDYPAWGEETLPAGERAISYEPPTESFFLEHLDEALHTLTQKQRFVICLYWGIGNADRRYNLREVADLMGVHHKSVQDLYERGMKRLHGAAKNWVGVEEE